MRFKTKFDRSLVVVLVLTAVLTCLLLPGIRLFAPNTRPVPLFAVLMPLLIWAIVLPATLPQYYDVRDDGLFVRQGWKKSLIPYASINEVQSVTDTRSAAVFSAERIQIVTGAGRRYVIAVAEEERFMDEMARRCPQLVRKPSGLGYPLAAPSDV